MQILNGLDGLRQLPHGAVMSIGNFDGLHRGHQRILEAARRRKGERGQVLAVVTFEPHPLTVLRPEIAPPRLSGPQIKQRLLRDAGTDYLVVLSPEPAVLNLAAEDFWRILRDEVRVGWLVEGEEFTFGKGRGGTIQKLREWTAQNGVHLEIVRPVKVALTNLSLVRISSSLVRWLVSNGRVRDAALCLGRPYTLEGRVGRGRGRGRGIGVPTANLDCADQLIPADGVYAGRCAVDGQSYAAAVSVGTMPTFNDTLRQLEMHLVGFDDRDLYDRSLSLEMLDWLREQRKFCDVSTLKRQMDKDIAESTQLQAMDPAVPIAKVVPAGD